MSLHIDQIKAFCSNLTLEKIYNFTIIFIVVITIVLATFALYRPINAVQLKHTLNLAQQYSLPLTQNFAEELLVQKQITRGQYLKLMQAYQQESKRAKQLPPVEQEF
ncbi:hypothetical protein A3K93_06345 [Acinetobacter sp. NCu2D-2]|uniref:hypothetical protein n=1 Tax=Acinetobacter sp. NCu2D-2 TaxID=1608473 RepID=UPI0007CDBC69|nr:hypothetical protein [Acinetobacter sp. NCu2D-2]ANF81845.1 hypothetical protein A3K93_06345 [Acinetobacter sp. NCu2D-2]